MVKQVDLLSYWMPFLRSLKEFKEIAKAEEPEVIALLEAIDTALTNFFIPTADEYGISRYESMLGLFPSEGEDLEARRFRVLSKWNDRLPYTEQELHSRLTSLCGADGYELVIDYANYTLTVKVALTNQDILPMVRELLDKMVPCNMVVHLYLMYTTHEWLKEYTHADLSQYTHEELTRLIQSKGE